MTNIAIYVVSRAQKSEQSRKKNKQRRLRTITLQEKIKKGLILQKSTIFSTKITLHFGYTINFFVDYIMYNVQLITHAKFV